MSRAQGTERASHVSAMPAALELHPPSGDRFIPHEVATLMRPLTQAKPAAPAFSVLMGNPLSPSSMSRGIKLSHIDHRAVALASSGGMSNVRFLAAISSQSAAYTVAADHSGFRKPKNLVKNNNSTFISRTFVHDQLAKRMREPELSPSLDLFNFERSISLREGTEVLAKIVFASEWPLCHSINPYTASAQQLDLVIGMSSGDLVWVDLVSQRYERINKTANITHTPVTAVSWLPNSESLVMAAHADGSVVVYDIYSEDANVPNYTAGANLSLLSSDVNDRKQCVKAVYKLSKKQITQILFVSATKAVIASKTDYLALFDLERETTTDLLPTFFGCVYCLAQSPDGRYLAAGGEDDMINVFDLSEEGMPLAARFQGHKAYVKSLSFDYFDSYEDGSYRLASIADDRQLIIWDFDPSMLPLPKLPPNAGVSSQLNWAGKPHPLQVSPETTTVHGRVPQFAAKSEAPSARVYVRTEEFGDSVLSDVKFTSTALVVASSDGRLWSWKRMKESPF